MNSFMMNGITWSVCYVEPYDDCLIDRTGVSKLATTDPSTCHVYVNKEVLENRVLWRRVIMHELAHCVMISYGLIGVLHQYVKRKYWFEAEEDLCNFIADYSDMIVDLTEYLSLN